MKMKMKTKSKKRRDDDGDDEDRPKTKSDNNSRMAEWRDAWGEGDDEAGGDERFDKLKDGKNLRRILPNRDPEEPFFVSFALHYNMGPDGQDKFRCIEPGGPFGHSKKKDKQRSYRAKKCPACKLYCKHKTKSRAFEWQSAEGKKYWRKHVAPYRAKHRFVWAQNAPKSAENKKKVLIFETGIMIAKPLIEAFYDENMGGDFTNPKTGRNVVITKTKLGKEANEVEYKTIITPDRCPLKLWKKLKSKLPDLTTFLPEELDPDAIVAIMEGDGSSGGDDDRPRKKSSKKKKHRDDDDDADLDDVDDDDDEDDGGRRHKLGKRRRGRDEDVDPDADEEDDEDSDDDDDEEEAPKKKKGKKSKTRDKLKKKARRDDEEDEDDDDVENDEDEDEDDDSDDDSDEDDDEDEDAEDEDE